MLQTSQTGHSSHLRFQAARLDLDQVLPEQSDDIGIELAVTSQDLHLRERQMGRSPAAVRTVLGHGGIGVCHSEDTGAVRQLGRLQSLRIARTIEPLVMVGNP